MEQRYWIGRKRSAMAMARNAATSEARLVHYELAGRYSIKAAHCLPFVAQATPRSTGIQAAFLDPTAPASHSPDMMSPPQRNQPRARRERDRDMGEGR